MQNTAWVDTALSDETTPLIGDGRILEYCGIPRILGGFDTCTNSVFQVLLSKSESLGMKLHVQHLMV